MKRGRPPTHGHWIGDKATPTWRSWDSMLQRCTIPRNSGFPGYGGRGIRVCERWASFVNFLTDMGERPRGRTLDRIDNDGNYEPGNCRWATRSEQANNTRTNRHLDHNGLRLTVAQWAERTGLAWAVIVCRLTRGWPVERALTTPKLMRRGK